MSEHSVEELIRQRDRAKSVAKDAQKSLEAAEARLYEKLYADCGYAGKVAITKNAPNGYLIVGAHFWQDGSIWSFFARKIKKDGSASEGAPNRIYRNEVLEFRDFAG